jgi:hypothetical protein
MAIFFGTVVNGQIVSSAFTLAATDRALLVGVSSHALLQWYVSFQTTPGGPFIRFLDNWSSVSGAVFAGANGGWGHVPYCPANQVRIETSAAVSATTSFQIIEAVAH